MTQLDLSPSPNIQETIDRKEVNGRIFEEDLSLPAEEGGGYYPSAMIGHRVGRYKIVRKLGWASSSTVWLCEDMHLPHKTYAAVKILSAHATATIVGGISAEYHVYIRIGSSNPNHPGFPHCLTMRHYFIARSSAGSHICFATDVLGSTMWTLRSAQPNKTFSVSVAKRIIKQVLLAVDYLHRECGYIHTDTRVDNILAVLPEPIVPLIDKYIEDHKLATYDNLEASPETIKSQPLTADFNDLRHLMVRLIDYGSASPIEKRLHDEFYQADIIRAPEVTLGHQWSTPVDIWSVGCLLFELVTNFHLFCQSGPYSADLHLQNIVECLGPFPPQFLEACSRRAEYFDEDGSLLRVDDFESCSLEDILYDLNTMHADDVPYLAAFMRRCLALDPASRASALELLEDKWLEDV